VLARLQIEMMIMDDITVLAIIVVVLFYAVARVAILAPYLAAEMRAPPAHSQPGEDQLGLGPRIIVRQRAARVVLSTAS
jgi:hypothetical protein